MKWTKEKLQEEANKYNTRREFRQNNSAAYSTSKNKKLLNELFKNHINKGYSKKRNVRNYWTFEKLQEEANKYKNVNEFMKNNKNAYQAASKKNYIKKLFKNHNCYSKPLKYDINFLKQEIIKYDTRKELIENNYPIYSYILKYKLLDELFNNHLNKGYIKSRQVWNKKTLQEEANKYKTRKEFSQMNKQAYSASNKKKLTDKLFKNHTNRGYLSIETWTDKTYFIYVYELVEYNKAYIGLTNNINRRDKEHLYDNTRPLNIFCIENNISLPKYKILEEKLKSNEAKDKEIFWIDFYKNKNWELFNINKGGSLGSYYKKWTIKKLQKEVNKYKTRWEFGKNNINAYNTAIKKGIMNNLFKNHTNHGYNENKKSNGYWTFKKLQKYANISKNRNDLLKNNIPAYEAARRLNLLDKLFKNHTNKGYINKWTKKQQS